MTAKYEQVALELREAIARAEYLPGSRLPSYAALRASHGVAQATIDKAFALLEHDGLIERRQRSGIFVSDPARRPPEDSAPLDLIAESLLIVSGIGARVLERLGHGGWAAAMPVGALHRAQAAGRPAFFLDPADLTPRRIEALVQRPPRAIAVFEGRDRVGRLPEPVQRLVARAGVPVGICGGDGEGGWLEVDHDHAAGASACCGWLVAQGRRRILPVGAELAVHGWWRRRLEGYVAACDAAGIAALAPLAGPPGESAPCDERSGFEHRARSWVGHLAAHVTGDRGPIDALLLPSDGQVAYVRAALDQLGIARGQILVAGYDDYWQEVPERAFGDPRPDVTVDKRNRELGAMLVDALLRKAAGKRVPQRQLVRGELVVPRAW